MFDALHSVAESVAESASAAVGSVLTSVAPRSLEEDLQGLFGGLGWRAAAQSGGVLTPPPPGFGAGRKGKGKGKGKRKGAPSALAAFVAADGGGGSDAVDPMKVLAVLRRLSSLVAVSIAEGRTLAGKAEAGTPVSADDVLGVLQGVLGELGRA